MRIPTRLRRSRHGVFYFRLSIPKRFRHLFGGTSEIKRSLATTDWRFASMCTRVLSVQADLAFRALDGDGMAFDPKHLDPNAIAARMGDNRRFELEIGATGVRIKTDPNHPSDAKDMERALAHIAPQLGEIIKASQPPALPPHTWPPQPAAPAPFMSIPNGDKTVEWLMEKWKVAIRRKDPKTVLDYTGSINRFFDWMKKRHDADRIVVSSVRAADVADYVEYLQLSGLKDTTIDDKHLAALSGFFKVAVKHEAWPREVMLPTANQRTMKKFERATATASRLPFDDAELKKIFAPGPLLAQKQPHQFWLPLLGLFTGARLNELCQLALSDIGEIEGIWAISINDEEYKKLKNTASRRTIPLHPQLIALGFLDYITDVKNIKDATRLFPYLNQDRYGSFIKNPSMHFAKYLDLPQISISHPQKVFHSFRSTANNALKRAGVHEEERCEMVGHEYATENHLTYSEPFPVSYLAENVIPKFGYPELDLSGLTYTPGRFAKALAKSMAERRRFDNHKDSVKAREERAKNEAAES